MSLLGLDKTSLAFAIIMLASVSLVVVVYALSESRSVLAFGVISGPLYALVLARTLAFDGPLERFAQWTEALPTNDWIVILLVVMTFTSMLYYASESLLAAVVFAPLMTLAAVVSAYVLDSPEFQLANRVGPELLVVGTMIGGVFTLMVIVALLRGAPLRLD